MSEEPSGAESAPESASTSASTPVAVFDMDGVLLSGDTFTELAMRRFRQSPARAVRLLGGIPTLAKGGSPAIRTVARRAVEGMTRDEYEALAADVAAHLAAETVHPNAIERIHGLLSTGTRVVIATASEEALSRMFLEAAGVPVDRVELVASRLALPEGDLNPHLRGEVKAQAVRERVGADSWEWAYSDAASDLPILSRARHPVMVNVKARRQADLLRKRPDVEFVEWADVSGVSGVSGI